MTLRERLEELLAAWREEALYQPCSANGERTRAVLWRCCEDVTRMLAKEEAKRRELARQAPGKGAVR